MKPRLKYEEVGEGALKAMYGLEVYLRHCGLEASLLHLIKFRVSQINGCAYCLDMHSKDLRAEGESEQRLYVLDAWREAPSILSVSEQHSLGPKPSRSSVKGMFRMRFMKRRVNNSTRRN